jgi:ketosteroid isomerase-like protein
MADFHPQVEWVLPAHQGFDSCIGPDQVRLFWEGLDDTMDQLQLRPQEYVDAGDRVAVRLRHYGRGRESGAEIDTEMYHQVTTFENGMIVRFDYVTTWAEALELISRGS